MFGDRLYTTERQLVVRGPNPAHKIAQLRPQLFSKINIKIFFFFFECLAPKKKSVPWTNIVGDPGSTLASLLQEQGCWFKSWQLQD